MRNEKLSNLVDKLHLRNIYKNYLKAQKISCYMSTFYKIIA